MRSYGGLKSQDVEKSKFFVRIWEKRPLLEKIQNSVPKGFIDRRVVFKYCEIWPTGNR